MASYNTTNSCIDGVYVPVYMDHLTCHSISTIVEAIDVTCEIFCQCRHLTGSYLVFQEGVTITSGCISRGLRLDSANRDQESVVKICAAL